MTWPEKAYPVLHNPYRAGKNFGVPEHWLAGLVSVESANLDPKAHRFEPGVFQSVMTVRHGGRSSNFPGFSNGVLAAYIKDPERTDDELRALATSYGLTQIMGYHYLSKWNLTPKEFQNLSAEESVTYSLRMMAEGMGWATKLAKQSGNMGRVQEYILRWWNTGSCTGMTYSPTYVERAIAMAQDYADYLGTMT